MSSYWVVRCPNCREFTYTDKFGKWKLCPVCGEVISLSEVPVYLEVNDFSEAEELISAVHRYLQHTGRVDLHPEEVALVRRKYSEWLKSS